MHKRARNHRYLTEILESEKQIFRLYQKTRFSHNPSQTCPVKRNFSWKYLIWIENNYEVQGKRETKKYKVI